MKYEISFLEDADLDIEETYIWYETLSLGLGKRFFDNIQNTIEYIITNPYMFQVVYKRIRRALVNKFPYGIYYIVENEKVIIIGILHFHRHSSSWEKRIL